MRSGSLGCRWFFMPPKKEPVRSNRDKLKWSSREADVIRIDEPKLLRMDMADEVAKLLRFSKCELGKFGTNGIALKVSFTTPGTAAKPGDKRVASFGLSRQLARSLAESLTKLLDAA